MDLDFIIGSGTTNAEDFDDVQASSGSQRTDYIPLVGIARGFGQQGRHLFERHPSPISAFQRLGSGTLGHGDFLEVCALLELFHQLIGLGGNVSL